jgi:hypothetical protein
MDHEVKMTYSGAGIGVGAAQYFVGGHLGCGELRIVEARPAKGVVYLLRGGDVRIRGTIGLDALGNETRITWTDEGDMGKNPLMHYAALMAAKMSGRPMEQGLRELKTEAERRTQIGN